MTEPFEPEDDDGDSAPEAEEPLGLEHEDDGGFHSDSVHVMDDEEPDYLEAPSGMFEEVAIQSPDLSEPDAFVDADPNARDAASGLTQQAEAPAEQAEAQPEVPEVDEAARRHLRGLLEALLFVSDRPMKAADLADHARADVKEVRSVLEALSEEYREQGRGFQLDELAGGFQIRTAAAFAPFVRDLTNAKPVRLSRAQVETLAIVAYRQPITRPEIEDIRGVDAGAVLKLLLDRDMVRILGKKDEPGRPLLYGTTSHFLTFFGLKTLKDLPTLREFTELTDESREVVERELGEVLPEEVAAAAAAERSDTEQQVRVEVPDERSETLETAVVQESESESVHVDENEPEREPEHEPADENENENESENEEEEDKGAGAGTEAANDTDDYKPGGSGYDPSDEELYPDDEDEDDDDEEDEEEDDEEEDEDDEDE